MRHLALVLCLSSAAASADKLKVDEAAPAVGDDGYKGVAPGAKGLPPHPPQLPLKSGPQRVTWCGFQVKDGVPTVFVELTAPPDYHIADQKNGLVVTLKNTVVPLKNNRRPLRVGAFDTAITNVETRQVGHDTQVAIRYKGDVAPAHREHVEAAAGGFQLLVIELPAK